MGHTREDAWNLLCENTPSEALRRHCMGAETCMRWYAEKLGEEATFTLMHRLIGRISETVHGHEGTVQNLTGDGVMALFGAPAALEDGPLKACRAALPPQARLQPLEDSTAAHHRD